MKICWVLCASLLVSAAVAWGQPPAPAPPAPPTPPAPAPAPSAAPAPAPGAAPVPVTPPPADPAASAPPREVPDTAPAKLFDTRVYGYINAFLTQIAVLTSERPTAYDRMAGRVVKEEEPTDFNVDAFVMIQGTIGDRYRYFLNVAAVGGGDPIESTAVELRNAWVEASLFGQALAVRAGKMYRRFGLYNEILDATPTFIGIKEPEILDEDHLMITRTTNLMLLGAYIRGVHKVEYSVTTGRDEREGNQVPLGTDVHYGFADALLVGVSYYDSMGKARPGVAVGEGSPKGGVADWMAEDRYRVVNAYVQVARGPWLAQLEYAIARHRAKRDPAATLLLAGPDAQLSPAQYGRFFTDPFDDTPPSPADVIEDATYTVHASYFRLGYEIRDGTLVPYLQGDYYRNPEIVPVRAFGGDFEAGYDDRGRFHKGTLGLLYRPLSPIALKVEYGAHFLMRWGDLSYVAPELRASFSYFWEL